MTSGPDHQPTILQIPHTASLFGAGKPVAIGYLGVSITEGYGASDPTKTSWRLRTTRYLRERFPESPVTESNVAIGGTGSDLGTFRCDNDLISRNPDLVFVEFAVNDYKADENRVLRAMEGIVRKIRCANLRTDIVFMYTATKFMEETYARDETPTSVAAHTLVAAHYGIPELNIGRALCEAVSGRFDGDWRVLTIDDVHPNDDGYAL